MEIFWNNFRDFSQYFSKFSKILLEIVLENISGNFFKYEGHSKNEACFVEGKKNAVCRTWNMSFEKYLRLLIKAVPKKTMKMLAKFLKTLKWILWERVVKGVLKIVQRFHRNYESSF